MTRRFPPADSGQSLLPPMSDARDFEMRLVVYAGDSDTVGTDIELFKWRARNVLPFTSYTARPYTPRSCFDCGRKGSW